jgi:hypothetical protein
MAIDSVRNQYESGKEWKSLQEIRGCLVDPIRKPLQRWHILFPAACCPAITTLPTDQMRTRYEVHETQDDASNEKP